MSEKPWPLPADTTTPPPGALRAACHVCGRPLPAQGVIFAQPHRYHTDCYHRLHAALWAKENAGKSVGQIRQLVGEDVKKGKR